jgi:hypothetical protein
MKLSVKPVPAARTLMHTSPEPGLGIVDSSISSKTSGASEPGYANVLPRHESTLAHPSPASASGCQRCLWMPVVALGLRNRRRMIDVAYGSIATEMGNPPHVWFTPDSDQSADIAGGPFRANKRLMHRSKGGCYSITSSARASTDGGIVRPSAFAVLRLITSSYLVGACTGRSAGFSPLRMRST